MSCKMGISHRDIQPLVAQSCAPGINYVANAWRSMWGMALKPSRFPVALMRQ
ncbi:MAG: hypothetical protein H6660_15510 [Ardenticatenaceae bacterium]|nr:hypothetical protein [Ardenticatenaceae bacterium]